MEEKDISISLFLNVSPEISFPSRWFYLTATITRREELLTEDTNRSFGLE